MAGTVVAISFGQYWHDNRIRNQEAISHGLCKLSVSDSRWTSIIVVCPPNPQFIEGARALGGKWRKRSLTWRFSPDKWSPVLTLCKEVFGSNLRVSDRFIME